MPRSSQIPLWGLFIIVACYAVTDAYPVLAPLMGAAVLATVLAPIVDRLERWQLPRPVSSALICATGLALAAGSFALLADVLADWADRLPRILTGVEERLRASMAEPGSLSASADKVEEIAKIATGEDEGSDAVAVELEQPGFVQRLLKLAPQITGMLGIFLFSLFFLLSEGDRLLAQLAHRLRRGDDSVSATETFLTLRQGLSRYFASISVINVTLGALTAGLLSLLDYPLPIITGIAACLLNFMPYIGALITATGIALVSLATGATLLATLLPTGLFLGLTVLEGQLITPMVLGRRLSLSPLAVFFSVVLLAWAWGVVGAILAVPFLTGAAIVLRHWPRLARPETAGG